YTITPSGATASNYNISYQSGTLTIEPAPLTITADDKSKVYGDPDPAFSASYDGLKLNDTPAVVSGLTFSRASGEDVGTYAIIPHGATASNYDITFVNGVLTIEPAPLTIKADDKSKVYGDPDPAFSASYDGLKLNDTPAVVSGLAFSREEGEDVGTYTITPSGATASNYNISYQSGTLTINPAPLTITADDKSKVYGDADPAFTASYDGLKLNDTPAVVSGLTISREEGEDVGTYTITPSGATASNYNISYQSGTLTINKANLKVIAEDKTKVYDGQPYSGFTVRYEGFKFDDDASDLGGTLSFEGVGVTAVNAGSYSIRPAGLTSNNYEIEFVTGTLTIQKANPTILSWPLASPILYGETLADSSLSMGIASVPGEFEFDDPDEAPGAGLKTVAVTFYPGDPDDPNIARNYNSVSGTVLIEVHYSLTLNASGGGSVTGEGTYLPGSVTISAIPDSGYRFVCWMEGGAIISDDDEYTFTLSGHRTLEAVFWEYDDQKTDSQTGIETTDGEATVDFHGGKVSIKITASEDISGGQIDVTLYDADQAKGAPKGMSPAGIFLRIERTDNLAGSTMRLVVHYDPANLPKGVKEKDLKLYRYVPESGWELVTPQGVNTAENYIWAELTDFSTFGVFGKVTASPGKALPETKGFQLFLITGAALAAMAGLAILLRRKMRIQS
ncbi:MAG: hypothetical protein GX044_06520, partial [Firmicutes bacterium]|nr:hypothetical protein [Bacillota bacterium]